MKTYPYLSLVVLMCLMGCSSSSITLGESLEPIEVEKVRVYLDEKPQCDFEVVAWLNIPGDYYNRGRLIDAFRQKAAQLGAEGLQITYLQKIGSTEYHGSARAIRCLNS